jgi:flagellar protein FliO/FliZ
MGKGETVLSLLWTLACIVVILVLAFVVTRLVAANGGVRRGGSGFRAGRLNVLSQLALGREQRLLLVEAGERYFLLGVTAGQITTLAELSREEAEACLAAKDGSDDPPQPPSFKEALHKVLQERKRR